MSLKVIHGWRDLNEAERGAAAALGNFDGVHLGHAQVIGMAREAAQRLGAPLAVITFDPHPRRVFRPTNPPFRLTTLGQQARALEALGVERLHMLPFDFAMASMSDRQFADEVLREGLGVRHIAVGFDISFGAGRTGMSVPRRTVPPRWPCAHRPTKTFATIASTARTSTQPIHVRIVSLASSVVSTFANTRVPMRTPGTDPADSQPTSPQCTVFARMCTYAPTGFMIAAATTSLETAVAGLMPNSRTSIGVTRAAPPMPVRPTTTPAMNPPTVRAKSRSAKVTASP